MNQNKKVERKSFIRGIHPPCLYEYIMTLSSSILYYIKSQYTSFSCFVPTVSLCKNWCLFIKAKSFGSKELESWTQFINQWGAPGDVFDVYTKLNWTLPPEDGSSMEAKQLFAIYVVKTSWKVLLYATYGFILSQVIKAWNCTGTLWHPWW